MSASKDLWLSMKQEEERDNYRQDRVTDIQQRLYMRGLYNEWLTSYDAIAFAEYDPATNTTIVSPCHPSK